MLCSNAFSCVVSAFFHIPLTLNPSRRRCNQLKNRYTDVLCLDHSRVVLNDPSEEKHNDYINANFVDGYKQKNAFISTQGNVLGSVLCFFECLWLCHGIF